MPTGLRRGRRSRRSAPTTSARVWRSFASSRRSWGRRGRSDWRARPGRRADMLGEQAQELERVSRRIGATIVQYCEGLLAEGRASFHVQELEAFVRDRVPEMAPGSPCRILRDLRQRGVVDYKVESRRGSK